MLGGCRGEETPQIGAVVWATVATADSRQQLHMHVSRHVPAVFTGNLSVVCF